MESEQMQGSPILEGETNYLHENAIEGVVNQTRELNEPRDVKGCVQKKVHQFFFIKFWPSEDQNVKSRIEEAKGLIEKFKQEELTLFEKHTKKMFDQNSVNSQLHYQHYNRRGRTETRDWRKDCLSALLEALDKLNFTENAYPKRNIDSCSSRELISHMRHSRTNNLAREKQFLRKFDETQQRQAESLNECCNKIWGLYVRIKWFSRDKQIFNEIHRLQGVWEKATADATQNGKIRNTLLSRKAIQDQVGLITKISEKIRMEDLEVRTKIKRLKKDLEVLERDIDPLLNQMKNLQLRQKQVNRHINYQLKKEKFEQDEANLRHSGYVSVMNNARELAEKKDLKALQELSLREVDLFMSEWNASKEFRYNYEKNILQSLDNRRFSRDGRTRNLNEQPIIREAQPQTSPSVCTDYRTRGCQCINCSFYPIEALRGKTRRKVPKLVEVSRENKNNTWS